MENIEKAQRSYKSYADTKRRSTNISIGDYVLLDARNLKIKGVASKKLFPKYVGPYRVLEEVGPDAFRIATPSSLRIHDVFHASLLKRYLGTLRSGDSVEVEDQETKEYEIEDIIGHRVRPGGRTEYLVAWVGYDASHNSYLAEDTLANA